MSDFFENIQVGSKSQATLENYDRRVKGFLLWLQEHHPNCWNNLDDVLPVYQRVTPEILCDYLAEESLDADGKMKSFSTPEGIRSMLIYLFKKSCVSLPSTFEDEWEEFSKGHRDKIAKTFRASNDSSAK